MQKVRQKIACEKREDAMTKIKFPESNKTVESKR